MGLFGGPFLTHKIKTEMRILQKQRIEDFLFIDIETATEEAEITEESPMWDAWEYDMAKKGITDVEDLKAEYKDRGALFAEYSLIVCITIGVVYKGKLRIKTFANEGDEKAMLQDFVDTLDGFVTNKTWLTGHAVIGFDAPFIMKRLIKNQVPVPIMFDTAHLKPWEVQYFDTAVLWKGTGFKTSSLLSVTSAMGLPSPKSDISGKDVGHVYRTEGKEGLQRIVEYCERDVVAVANLVRKFRYEEPLELDEKSAQKEPEGLLTYLYTGGKYTDEVKEKLKKAFKKLNADEKKMALDILGTIPSRAKGKETDFKKSHIKELFKK